MTTENAQIRMRPASAGDINFIFNSWLKSFRYSKQVDGVPNPVFYGQQHKLIERLLKRCHVQVACNASDVYQIFGYICSETVQDVPVVHFLYVKESYRKLGVAKLLLDFAGIDIKKPMFYTHRTQLCSKLEQKYALINNPYLAYVEHHQDTISAVEESEIAKSSNIIVEEQNAEGSSSRSS